MTPMSLDELKTEMGLKSRNQVYAYFRSGDIPIEKIGKRIGKHYLVFREKFEKWILETPEEEEATDLRILNGKVRRILK